MPSLTWKAAGTGWWREKLRSGSSLGVSIQALDALAGQGDPQQPAAEDTKFTARACARKSGPAAVRPPCDGNPLLSTHHWRAVVMWGAVLSVSPPPPPHHPCSMSRGNYLLPDLHPLANGGINMSRGKHYHYLHPLANGSIRYKRMSAWDVS